jgi:cell division septation protein DedD
MFTSRPADAEQLEAGTNEPETKKQPVPMVWIPATLCVGLLIAAIYLGGRIVTASHRAPAAHSVAVAMQKQAAPIEKAPEPVQKAAAPVAAPPVVVPAKPAAPVPVQAVSSPNPTPPKRQTDSDDIEKQIPMITPKAGERYIQVGALDPDATRRYIPQLRQLKLEPHVAPGPKPELLRVLIGPFANQDAVASIKNELDSARIENFVRRY